MANERLVDAQWLAKAVDEKRRNVRILDCTYAMQPKSDNSNLIKNGQWNELMQRSTPYKELYQSSHIPTAVHIDLDIATYAGATVRFAMHPPEVFEQYVQQLGVNDGDHIVLYGRGPMGGMLFAARFWWMFRMYGQSDVSLLDGGLTAWQAQGLETSSGTVAVEKGNWKAKQFHPDMMIAYDELTQKDDHGKDMIDRHEQTNLLDARPAKQFSGEEETSLDPTKVNGSFVPGFHSAPASELVDKDGRMKSPESIKQTLSEHGYRPGLPAVTSCGGGIQASLLAFGIQQAYADAKVRVYNGSIKEMELLDPKRISGGKKSCK